MSTNRQFDPGHWTEVDVVVLNRQPLRPVIVSIIFTEIGTDTFHRIVTVTRRLIQWDPSRWICTPLVFPSIVDGRPPSRPNKGIQVLIGIATIYITHLLGRYLYPAPHTD